MIRKKLQHTLQMSRISNIAYDDFITAKKKFKALGYSNVLLVDTLGTQVYLAQKHGQIVVAFRGTEPSELADIMTDIRCKQVPFLYGMVHQGFLEALELVYEDISKQLREWYVDEDVIFTGHSMGAALATICAVKIRLEHGISKIQITNFGCPRVGNKDFIKGYNSLFQKKSIRVINDEDIVPKLPTNLHMKYYHVEDLYFITDQSTFIDVPGFYPYVSNLIEYVSDYWGIRTSSENEALKKLAIENAKELVGDHSIGSYFTSLEECLR